MNEDAKKYISQTQKLFQSFGEREKDCLNTFEQQILSYVNDNPETTYNDLIDVFGNPSEFVTSYYESAPQDLIKKISWKKYLHLIVLIVIILAICIMGFVVKSYLDGRNSYRSIKEIYIEEH